MSKGQSSLSLDMRCPEEGRCTVQLGIDFLTPGERSWLFALLQAAQEGRQMNFGAETTPTGETILRFHLAAPEAQNGHAALAS
jgi:hypothetical protein